VDHAISGHLLSDVPVGLFLSAGVDSSAIASVCSRLGRTLEAWTFSMGDAGGADEVPVAAELARRFGLSHSVVKVSLAQTGEAFDRFVDGQDQPGVDGFNTWLMARACREQGGKVALSGLGGDELFGGYEGLQQIPRLHALLRLLRPIQPAWRRRLAVAMSRRLTPCQREKLEDMVGSDWSLNELAVMRRRLFSQSALVRLGFEDARQPGTWLPVDAELDAGTTRRDPLAAMGLLDARFYMRNMLLRDSDVHGMAHGLEIRVPWLDSGLARLVLSMPGEWRKPRKRINKPLLVEAAGVPTIVTARRKTGFTLPYAHWLKTGLRDRREAARERLLGQGDLDPAGVRRVFEDFEKHPQGPEWSRVWMLMTLCRWRENFAVLKKEVW
jgi:asparagine synthase (glutamine-hydrolysing)